MKGYHSFLINARHHTVLLFLHISKSVVMNSLRGDGMDTLIGRHTYRNTLRLVLFAVINFSDFRIIGFGWY